MNINKMRKKDWLEKKLFGFCFFMLSIGRQHFVIALLGSEKSTSTIKVPFCTRRDERIGWWHDTMYISVTTCLSFVFKTFFSSSQHNCLCNIKRTPVEASHFVFKEMIFYMPLPTKYTEDLIAEKCHLIFYAIVQSILWCISFYKAFC